MFPSTIFLSLPCSVFYIFSAKKADLVENKAQLQKQSQGTQEELDGWVTVFTELKTGLTNQRKEFTLQLEETEQEVKEDKQRLLLVEKEITESKKEKKTLTKQKDI